MTENRVADTTSTDYRAGYEQGLLAAAMIIVENMHSQLQAINTDLAERRERLDRELKECGSEPIGGKHAA